MRNSVQARFSSSARRSHLLRLKRPAGRVPSQTFPACKRLVIRNSSGGNAWAWVVRTRQAAGGSEGEVGGKFACACRSAMALLDMVIANIHRSLLFNGGEIWDAELRAHFS